MQVQSIVPSVALGIVVAFTPMFAFDSENHAAPRVGMSEASLAPVATCDGGCGCEGVSLPCTNQGDANDNTFNGTTANECYDGLAGDDTINGDGGGDCLFGGPGNDVIDGGDCGDFIKGEAGLDRLIGGTGDDCLEGGPDDDILLGQAGDDNLTGGAQDDCIKGGPDDDYCWGSFGDDKIVGGTGSDELFHHRKAPNPLWESSNGVDCIDATDGAAVDTVYAGSEDFVFIDDGDTLVLLNVDASTEAILGTVAASPLTFTTQADYVAWRERQGLDSMPDDCDC